MPGEKYDLVCVDGAGQGTSMVKDQNFQTLLAAENDAERIIDEARAHRDQLLKDALEQTHQQEARFEKRIPEIREAALHRAVQHADQVISDYQHRHDERSIELRELAEQREGEALDISFQLFMNSTD